MHRACFAIPGDLESPTGGYAYARALLRAIGASGWQFDYLALPDGFPDPDAAALAACAAAFRGSPPEVPLLVDGLAYGTFPADLLQEQAGRWVALVHHPLALETGLPPERAAALRASELAALKAAEAIVVTSPQTGRTLSADYQVAPERISVAEPGTALPERPAAGNGSVPTLLCVGTLSHRKGQDVLIQALAQLGDLVWRCRLVGSDRRDPGAAQVVRQLVARFGLEDRVEIVGAVSAAALDGCYRQADLFVLPTRYEGYGMVFAEAMAHGLPIVACPTGAVPGTVPPSAALFVPPEEPDALAAALRRILCDGALRQKKAAGAWAAGRRLPSWQDTARQVAGALSRALPR